MSKSVALKVTFNDGGADEGGLIGYRGVCSPRTMLHNVKEKKRVNCCREDGLCRKFVDGGLVGKKPTLANKTPWCYESTLLKDGAPWRFGSGKYHNGPRTGEAMAITGLQEGDFAFLTTVAPGADESQRFVFALYRVGLIDPDDEWGNFITSDQLMEHKLPDSVARSLLYWDYNANRSGGPLWGSGLFRYLGEAATNRLLADFMGLLGNTSDRDRLYGSLGGKVSPTTARTAGYGGGGEGEAHRELKLRVAADSTLIGLPADAKVSVEHSFKSGDRVDLLFEYEGRSTVVEIETTVTLPGAHQCIKYRALREAELGLAIGVAEVEAVLVANSFDQPTIDFASQYGIRLVQLT